MTDSDEHPACSQNLGFAVACCPAFSDLAGGVFVMTADHMLAGRLITEAAGVMLHEAAAYFRPMAIQ